MKISIGKAANILGVSKETLRRWEKLGKIKVIRTPQNHRRYDLSSLQGGTIKNAITTDKITIQMN
jgi:excisionase family DNA binding protein